MIALVLEVITVPPHQRHPDLAQRHLAARRRRPFARRRGAGRSDGQRRHHCVALLFAALQLRHVAGHALVGGEQILGRLQHLRVMRRRRIRLAAEAERGARLVLRIVAGGQQLGGALAHFDLEIDLLLEIEFLHGREREKGGEKLKKHVEKKMRCGRLRIDQSD